MTHTDTARFKVTFEARFDPDRQREHREVRPLTVEKDTLHEVVDVAKRFRDVYDIENGRWVNPVIYDTEETGLAALIGYISHNGQVWTMDNPLAALYENEIDVDAFDEEHTL